MSAIKRTIDENNALIKIAGDFTFAMQQDFRKAYQDLSRSLSYVVDLQNTKYMDSSALGMLLMLRDHAGGDNASISLVNCNPTVSQILKISNLNRLFSIS